MFLFYQMKMKFSFSFKCHSLAHAHDTFTIIRIETDSFSHIKFECLILCQKKAKFLARYSHDCQVRCMMMMTMMIETKKKKSIKTKT